MSEPPSRARASNCPPYHLPKRVSRRPVVPPKGALWQVTHDASLNTGPSPSSTVSVSEKSSVPASKLASSAGVSPAIGPPRVVASVRLLEPARSADRSVTCADDGASGAVLVCLSLAQPKSASVATRTSAIGVVRAEDGERVDLHCVGGCMRGLLGGSKET